MKRFYKILTLILGFCFIFTLLNKPISVNADSGPKPSVNITLNNLEETAYITLLSSREYNGPYMAVQGDDNPLSYKDYRCESLSDEVFLKFVNYVDKDNYYFICYANELTKENNIFKWGYYPPNPFKILIYFESSDTFVTSDIMERYAFDSYYEIDVNTINFNDALDVVELNEIKKTYNYFGESLFLLIRIVLTITVELLVALLFFHARKKLFIQISVVNIITQLILNIGLNIVHINSGWLAYILLYILLEFLVFVIEAIAFSVILSRNEEINYPKLKGVGYALIANIISFVVGFILALYLPFGF